MKNRELYEQFKQLRVFDFKEDKFSVVPVGVTRHKLSMTKEGYPMFFLATTGTASHVANTILNILSVEYNLSCTFIDDDRSKLEAHYTVVTLRSVDDILLETFFDLVLLMIERLPKVPSKKEISVEVENLVSIFSAMACPPRNELQGLWAELLVIERSADSEIVGRAWHESPTAKYDFIMGRDKIEVKSTAKAVRVHRFTLEQLTPSAHSRVVVASCVVRESAAGNGGLSVVDLYDKICLKVQSADVRIHILKVIAETLGTDAHKGKEVCFDYAEASDSLRFYDSKDVPGVDEDGVQQGVSSVGFNSDLTAVPDISKAESSFVMDGSPLYNALLNK